MAVQRYDIHRRDGSWEERYWAPLNVPVLGPDGDVRYVLHTVDDVTARHEADLERDRLLAVSETARMQVTAVLESIGDAFYAVDSGFRFTYVNRQAEAFWGRRREDLVGKNFWTEFPQAVGSEAGQLHLQAMVQRRPAHFETISPVIGRWIEVSLYPESGGGLACYFRDISERKAAEAERERLLADAQAARAEAEAANRAKSDFLAVMSHELRTPLNAIGGYAQLIELGVRGPITPEQLEDLRRVQASQRHLLGLINEVLNYAKLETGVVHYDVEPVRMRDVLAGAEALVSPQGRAKGLTLAVAECPPEVVVRADAEKLRQILVNLLSNAVKFTGPGGRVTLACEVIGERLHVTVQDTGIGIEADQIGRIFDPFVQVRSDLTRTAEGTGLGLAISRDLARGMGGDLTVESTPGVGSTFTLTLPVA
jgi:PAS domain S-box-containing protein